MPGPLHGLRVVDLSTMLAGPYATMLLADLGAEVIKVEPPRGDGTRRAGPYRPEDGRVGLAGYFQSVNRGKHGVVLDLKAPSDVERLLTLVRQADVLVENYSSGVMDRLGLGYERLAAENPRLVYAALRGFGDPRTGASPYAAWPAFDIVAQAMGGFLGITGTADGSPVKSGPGVGDIFPAVLLTVGVLAAVHHARETGQGQFVDVAMYDAILSLCERMVYQHSYTGEVPRPQGNGHPLFSPFDIFPTADGWVAVAAPHDGHWRLLAEAIGGAELADDPRFRTNPDRVRHTDEVRALVGGWLATRPTADVVGLLGGRVPIGPVNDVAAIVADPHVAARQMLVELEQPGSDRPIVVAGQPLKFTATPAQVARRAPTLGEEDVDAVIARWAEPLVRESAALESTALKSTVEE
jgi:crotonobetainyl-CoA:carnitine CoA-transferase CaiB-like acyl-CoA transferase